ITRRQRRGSPRRWANGVGSPAYPARLYQPAPAIALDCDRPKPAGNGVGARVGPHHATVARAYVTGGSRDASAPPASAFSPNRGRSPNRAAQEVRGGFARGVPAL